MNLIMITCLSIVHSADNFLQSVNTQASFADIIKAAENIIDGKFNEPFKITWKEGNRETEQSFTTRKECLAAVTEKLNQGNYSRSTIQHLGNLQIKLNNKKLSSYECTVTLEKPLFSPYRSSIAVSALAVGATATCYACYKKPEILNSWWNSLSTMATSMYDKIVSYLER